MLQLRLAEHKRPTNEHTEPLRNEMANPVVVGWAVLLLFAELAIDAEGIQITFMVGLEVIAATAEVLETLRKKTKAEKECQRHLNECLMTSRNDREGNNWNERRCLTCFGICRQSGKWPESIPIGDGIGTCSYPGIIRR
jgi:hypothetical protein